MLFRLQLLPWSDTRQSASTSKFFQKDFNVFSTQHSTGHTPGISVFKKQYILRTLSNRDFKTWSSSHNFVTNTNEKNDGYLTMFWKNVK